MVGDRLRLSLADGGQRLGGSDEFLAGAATTPIISPPDSFRTRARNVWDEADRRRGWLIEKLGRLEHSWSGSSRAFVAAAATAHTRLRVVACGCFPWLGARDTVMVRRTPQFSN